VSAIVRAAPALNPSRIVSLTKLIKALRWNSQARKLSPATTSAVSEAISAHRMGSSPAIAATVVPTSMAIAEVGPIANCRDVANRAYAGPPTR
jgi:hypothetical protein